MNPTPIRSNQTSLPNEAQYLNLFFELVLKWTQGHEILIIDGLQASRLTEYLNDHDQ